MATTLAFGTLADLRDYAEAQATPGEVVIDRYDDGPMVGVVEVGAPWPQRIATFPADRPGVDRDLAAFERKLAARGRDHRRVTVTPYGVTKGHQSFSAGVIEEDARDDA